jgi:integral membrane sensor domain MASE1
MWPWFLIVLAVDAFGIKMIEFRQDLAGAAAVLVGSVVAVVVGALGVKKEDAK